MNSLGDIFEQRLIESNFSIEEVSKLFLQEGIQPPQELYNQFKPLYFDIKNILECTDTTIGICSVLFVNFSLKEQERNIDSDSFKTIRKGLKDFEKLHIQIQKKINNFQEKYPNLNLGLKSNISNSDLSNFSEDTLIEKISKYRELVENFEEMMPPQRKRDDYYSNLIQLRIKGVIALNTKEVWPTFIKIINLLNSYFPDLLSNIESELTMNDKETLRKRLKLFEEYYLDNSLFKLHKAVVQGGRKD